MAVKLILIFFSFHFYESLLWHLVVVIVVWECLTMENLQDSV